jgi:hypothetical protein
VLALWKHFLFLASRSLLPLRRPSLGSWLIFILNESEGRFLLPSSSTSASGDLQLKIHHRTGFAGTFHKMITLILVTLFIHRFAEIHG